MMSCDDARILSMDEITEWDGKTMWMMVRERIASWPVIYDHEHIPYLVFRAMKGDGMYYLRPALMGKTWVMFDRKPGAALRRKTFRKEEQAG